MTQSNMVQSSMTQSNHVSIWLLVFVYISQFFSVWLILLWIILLSKEFVWNFVLETRFFVWNNWKYYRKPYGALAYRKKRVCVRLKNFKSGHAMVKVLPHSRHPSTRAVFKHRLHRLQPRGPHHIKGPHHKLF